MKKLTVLALSFFMLSSSAFAGFYLDPYIGWGTVNVSSDAPGDDNDNQGGAFLGSRVGWMWGLVGAGVNVNTGGTSDYTRTNSGVFLEVDLPILLRFWGEYIVSSEFDTDTISPNYDFKDGYTLGAGTTILPFVSLNLEYSKATYDVDVLSQSFDVDTDSFLLSVSLPLDF